jgi:small-conductance mechanosensitive channel
LSAGRQLDAAIRQTDGLSKSLDAIRTPLLAQARSLVQNGMRGASTTDPAQLEAARRELQAATARFKELAALLVPLGEQDIAVDTAHDTLAGWRDALHERLAETARYLMLRVSVLAALVVAVLAISEVWRRATFRYLHDARRRRQFLTLRRVAVAIALTFIIGFGFVSEFGSVATYIGFVTAGLAVALQNVILAVVGYFFLIGRYGVRVGDRVTLAGVTGSVVEIGLVRIFLMELAGPDLHSTGRMVALSNAVLFQPQALFRQLPGAEFLWHVVTLVLDPTVDLQHAEARVRSAANAVFEQYGPAFEEQYAVVQRQVDFETTAPRPEVRTRLTAKGLEFDVRYPVQPAQAAAIDQRMIQSLHAELAREPALALAPAGEPALKGADA